MSKCLSHLQVEIPVYVKRTPAIRTSGLHHFVLVFDGGAPFERVGILTTVNTRLPQSCSRRYFRESTLLEEYPVFYGSGSKFRSGIS